MWVVSPFGPRPGPVGSSVGGWCARRTRWPDDASAVVDRSIERRRWNCLGHSTIRIEPHRGVTGFCVLFCFFFLDRVGSERYPVGPGFCATFTSIVLGFSIQVRRVFSGLIRSHRS